MSGPDIHEWASTLGGDLDRDQHGQQCIRAPGPGHSAEDRSLAVYPTDDGDLRTHSFAGDDPIECRDYARQKLGLPAWTPGHKGNGKGNGKHPPHGQEVDRYVYEDPEGKPRQAVVRYEPKSFAQMRPYGGGWRFGGIQPKMMVPYKLPELIEAMAMGRTVYVCEGEKAVKKLWGVGLPATCSPGGAGKWPEHFAAYFGGASVVVLPDNDKPGRDHALMVKANLDPVAASVRIVALPGLKPGQDVVDWIEGGGDPAAIATMEGEPLEPEAKPNRERPPHAFRADQLQSMVLPPLKVIVPNYLTVGLTILGGKPKVRKSWLALDLCLSVARGGWTLSDQHCLEGDVLFVALEDGPRRLQTRLNKIASIGSWPSRLTMWTELERLDAGGEDRLRAWIKAQPDPRLIVLDTLGLVRPVKMRDEDPYVWDSRCARQLKALADEFDIAIIAIHHVRKMAADDPLEMLSGTNGLSGGADAILVLAKTAEGATLYGRSRDLEDIEVAVEFDPQTCRWRVLGEAREVRLSDERKRILDALRQATEPLTPAEIADETGMVGVNVRQLLRSLGKGPEPAIMKAGRGKYVIAPSQPSQDHTPGDLGAVCREERAP